MRYVNDTKKTITQEDIKCLNKFNSGGRHHLNKI